MLIPKKNRIAIYEYLFKEGIMVAKKDFNLAKHPEIEGVPNLEVIKAAMVWKSVIYEGFVLLERYKLIILILDKIDRNRLISIIDKNRWRRFVVINGKAPTKYWKSAEIARNGDS